MKTPVILLACGCFNPATNMHLRMFEIARDFLHRIEQYEVIGGIISPVHDGYGKKELEAATHRLNMIKLALQGNDWVKLSDWESKQETWTRTRQILQYHQNHLNAYLHTSDYNVDVNEEDLKWMPDNIRKRCGNKSVIVKLLCGADLLESFGTPGLWADEDIEDIVGQHGLVVITRSDINPSEFIYNSDLLTKYMFNITIVTEWIRNEISSTKIRRALRRSESVKYLIPDDVIEYIHKHSLYGSKKTSVKLEYKNSDARYNGIQAFRYEAPSTLFRSSTPNPENDCFCTKSTKDAQGNENCYLDGVFDFKHCIGSPIVASMPHYLNADQKYLDNFEDLKPNETLHGIYLLLEPNTGTPLQARKRIQLNSILHKVPLLTSITPDNMVETVFPFLWLEESVDLPEEYVDLLNNQLFKKVTLANGIADGLVAVASVLFVIILFFLIRKLLLRNRTQ